MFRALIQVLKLGLLSSGGLRNWPPASAPSTAVSSDPMIGDFGPSAVSIVRLLAGGGTGQASLDSGDNITIFFSELSNCAGQPEVSVWQRFLFFCLNSTCDSELSEQFINKAAVDLLIDFNQAIGANYSGHWLNRCNLTCLPASVSNGIYFSWFARSTWTSPMGTRSTPSVAASSILVITISNVTGAAPPTIGSFAVRVKASAGLRNIPPVCQPSSALSPPLAGGFGPSRIVITDLSAAPPSHCNESARFISSSAPGIPQPPFVCDSVYGPGDRLILTFDQNVTLCLGVCG